LFEAIVEENDISDEQKARISKKLGEADKVTYDPLGINIDTNLITFSFTCLCIWFCITSKILVHCSSIKLHIQFKIYTRKLLQIVIDVCIIKFMLNIKL